MRARCSDFHRKLKKVLHLTRVLGSILTAPLAIRNRHYIPRKTHDSGGAIWKENVIFLPIWGSQRAGGGGWGRVLQGGGGEESNSCPYRIHCGPIPDPISEPEFGQNRSQNLARIGSTICPESEPESAQNRGKNWTRIGARMWPRSDPILVPFVISFLLRF